MTVKLLTEHHLEFRTLKGGCIGLFESTLVKILHCWKSYVAALILLLLCAISTKISSPKTVTVMFFQAMKGDKPSVGSEELGDLGVDEAFTIQCKYIYYNSVCLLVFRFTIYTSYVAHSGSVGRALDW